MALLRLLFFSFPLKSNTVQWNVNNSVFVNWVQLNGWFCLVASMQLKLHSSRAIMQSRVDISLRYLCWIIERRQQKFLLFSLTSFSSRFKIESSLFFPLTTSSLLSSFFNLSHVIMFWTKRTCFGFGSWLLLNSIYHFTSLIRHQTH